MKITKSEWN